MCFFRKGFGPGWTGRIKRRCAGYASNRRSRIASAISVVAAWTILGAIHASGSASPLPTFAINFNDDPVGQPPQVMSTGAVSLSRVNTRPTHPWGEMRVFAQYNGAGDGRRQEPAAVLPAEPRGEPAGPRLSGAFEIVSLRRSVSAGYIFSDGGWQRNIRCIHARVRYQGSRQTSDGFVKAYFYDNEGRLIHAFDRAPRRQTVRRGQYETAPEIFSARTVYDVYFPISQSIQDRGWSTVLIVFGTPEQVTAAALPDVDFSRFDFDERPLLFPDAPRSVAGAAAAASSASSDVGPAGPGLVLEMDRVFRARHGLALIFNGAWRRGELCLRTRVRSIGGTPVSALGIRAFFYDEQRRMVAVRDVPSQVEVTPRNYIRTPVISRSEQWYPVFFALDGELAQVTWQWAVIAAEADGQVAAALFGPEGPDLRDFDFQGRHAFP